MLSKTETRSLYDRFGHAGLRSGGFRPTPFDYGSLADIFSAFFGDDVFGVLLAHRTNDLRELISQLANAHGPHHSLRPHRVATW